MLGAWKEPNVVPFFVQPSKLLTGESYFCCCKVLEQIIEPQVFFFWRILVFLLLTYLGLGWEGTEKMNFCLHLARLADMVDDVVFLNHSTAFNVVYHLFLLSKIRCVGISGRLDLEFSDWKTNVCFWGGESSKWLNRGDKWSTPGVFDGSALVSH